MHLVTLLESGKTITATRAEALGVILRHLRRLRRKLRSRKPSPRAQAQGADIFTEQIGGHFH